MADNTLLYRTAISFVRGATAELLRVMEMRGVSEEEFFEIPMAELNNKLGVQGGLRLDKVYREEALNRARNEIETAQRYKIDILPYGDDRYPAMLREIPDAPTVLYKFGEADLGNPYNVSVVGTRKPTGYGAEFCRKFGTDLAALVPEATIVSGLAYGIDAMSHTAALDNGLPTIAVVGTGLHTIYPAANRQLAAAIVKNGGAIVSEYPYGTPGGRNNFLSRNRIIAGMSMVTLVVESAAIGGSLSTANYAFGYNREVHAVPGRITDPLSEGCNNLIRNEKARMVTSAADMITALGWKILGKKIEPKQLNLFPDLDGDRKLIYEKLQFKSEPVSVDMLHQLTGIPMPVLMSTLTEMEFDGMITRLPGARYEI